MARRASRPLGSVRQITGDRWEMRYRGASKTVRAKSAAEAKKALAKWIADVNPERSADTLAGVCRDWLNATKQRKGDRTVEEQNRIIRLHIEPSKVGQMNAGAVRVKHLEDFYRSLLEPAVRPPRKEPYGLGGGTIKHVHDIINAALRWAQRRGKIDRSPAADVEELPSLGRRPVEAPDLDELGRILTEIEAGDDHRLTMFVRLAIVTGARRGEIAGLRWSDVTDAGALRLRRAVSEMQGGRLIVKETKTALSRRVVALDENTLKALRLYSVWLRTGSWSTGPNSYLFPAADSTGSQPDRPSRYSAGWSRVARSLDLNVRLHDLRHLVASLLLDAGVPVSEVSAQLGHARRSTTMDIYGHLIGDRAHERAEIIATILNHRRQLPAAIETGVIEQEP